MTEEKRIQAWSSGGGTQSTAIAALIYMGVLQPDIGIIVDTEREAAETFAYLHKWVLPAFDKIGFKMHIVTKSDFAKVDLWGGKNKDDLLIPAFTDESGRIGKLSTYCSNEWKARVAQRYLNTIYPPETKFTQWIGYSFDEPKRLKQNFTPKWQQSYPLFDMRARRAECVEIVRKVGWPDPPRSSCWMCPNRSHAEWMHLKHNAPEDWQKAVDFESEIRKTDEGYGP